MNLYRHSLYRPSTLLKLLYIWGLMLIKGVIRHKRFIAISPPFLKTQYVYDRLNRNFFDLMIRDGVDWTQLEHIFLCEEYNLDKTQRMVDIVRRYEEIVDSGLKPLIVDCGANIGLASHYFSSTYPEAKVTAVEPDPHNLSVAKFNCKDCDAVFLHAAISSETGCGQLIDMGSSNAFRVAHDTTGDLKFVTVDMILDENKSNVPFIIKIDIEGFERDLFAKNTGWIDKFPILIIELHDWMLPKTNTSQNFLREMAGRNRDFMHYDGYVVSISNDI